MHSPYFSFPVAPTTVANSATCIEAMKASSKNYDDYTSGLQRAAYTVAINVPEKKGTAVKI